jgi:hypothetical protein
MKKHQWQPIETAPKDGTEFLGWSGRHVWIVRWLAGFQSWLLSDGGRSELTHWMPLPDPPEVKDA